MGLQALVYSIGYVLASGIGFLTLSILTHLLVPAEYAVYSTAVNFAMFAGSFLFAWTRFSAGRYEADATGDIALTFWIRCFASIIPVAMILFAIGAVLGTISFLTAFALVTLCMGQSLFELTQEFRRARLQVRQFTIHNLLRSVLSISMAIPVAYLFREGELIVITLGLSFFIAAIVNIVNLRRGESLGKPKHHDLRKVMVYGAGLAASGLVFTSIGVISRLMVVKFVGLDAAGPYTASLDLAGQIGGIVAMSVSSVIAPMIYKSYSTGNQAAVVENFSRGAELLLAALVPMTIGLVLVSTPLVKLLTGAAYHSVLIELLPWTIVSISLANFTHNYLHIAFQMTSRPIFQIASGLCQLAALIVISYIFISYNGLLGAAQSLLLTNILTMIITAVLARRTFPIPFPAYALLKVLAAGAVMAFAVLSVGSVATSDIGELIVKVTTGVLAFGIAALLLNICDVRTHAMRFRRPA